MDKFYGISRAEIIAESRGCEITAKTAENSQKSLDKPAAKKGKKLGWIRYSLSALLILVCVMGRFSDLTPFKTASDFIKTQLSRDIVRELKK